jgi:hypothetical protein
MDLSPEASQAVASLVKVLWDIREDRKIFDLLLDHLAGLFSGTGGAVFLCKRRSGRLHKIKSLPREERWDSDTIAAFYRNQKPRLGADTIMAPVRVGDEVVGVLALAREGGFPPKAGKAATEILKIVGRALGARRRAEVLAAAGRLAGALARGVGPKDVAYRAFHSMRRFIDYDHGATLAARLNDETALVVARQVTWTNGKSDLVGTTFPFAWSRMAESPALHAASQAANVPWNALNTVREEGSPERLSSLAVALGAGRQPIGLVEVASSREGFFRESDITVLDAFAPYLAWCLGAQHGFKTEKAPQEGGHT